jgi:hypothetical protein
MTASASNLAHSLSRDAEAVCRHYLSNGRRSGGYWIVGDVRNAPGASTFVRLKSAGPSKGAAGKWADAESGEHGDLLDVIRETLGLTRFRDVADEARRFLNLPRPAPEKSISPSNAPARTSSSAKRLLALCRPIDGSLAETYLRRRGVTAFGGTESLRFHPSCFYRADANSPIEKWPALVAAVTDLSNRVTGVHRTWLDPELGGADHGKASIENPRRSLGDIWTHAVRFGVAQDVMAAGEGIETILSLRSVLPALPMIAALSASNLAAVVFPAALRRLYVAMDADPAGERAAAALAARAVQAGIEAIVLRPVRNDFNDDLSACGVDELGANLRPQLAAEDVRRFMDR